MAKIRCNACGTEIEVIQSSKGKGCGCDNHTYLSIDRNGLPSITAENLSVVTAISGFTKPKEKRIDTTPSPGYTKRVPRKLDFEIR